MRTRLGLAVVGVCLLVSGCSSPCESLGPVEGWDPATLGFEELPPALEAIEHHQAPDPTGNQCQTYVFLASDEDSQVVERSLRNHFEAQGMQLGEGDDAGVWFRFTGTTAEANVAVWVRQLDEFSTLGTGIGSVDHIRDRGDVVVVLSIGS